MTEKIRSTKYETNSNLENTKVRNFEAGETSGFEGSQPERILRNISEPQKSECCRER